MKTLLITGAAGNLGQILRRTLAGYADTLRLSDIQSIESLSADEEFVSCDLSDLEQVMALVEGCDGIVHMGGISVEAPFDDLVPANIIGTYNLYEAARIKGVERILFASSNHVTGFHPRTTPIDVRSPLRPDCLYGVTKCYGEALSRLYFDKYGIETVNVRIGSCFERPRNRRMLSTWLSPDDFTSLVRAVFDAPVVDYLTLYGVSNNKGVWWKNDGAEFLGWQPADSSERFREEIEASDPPEDGKAVAGYLQGGPFAT
ncbi:NAD-dependent epimerase/dehydratase family protein [Kushneria sp. EE4]